MISIFGLPQVLVILIGKQRSGRPLWHHCPGAQLRFHPKSLDTCQKLVLDFADQSIACWRSSASSGVVGPSLLQAENTLFFPGAKPASSLPYSSVVIGHACPYFRDSWCPWCSWSPGGKKGKLTPSRLKEHQETQSQVAAIFTRDIAITRISGRWPRVKLLRYGVRGHMASAIVRRRTFPRWRLRGNVGDFTSAANA
jgi:hypothetical protein